MDKRKLVNIIVKDLEELKILTEEVAESRIDTSMIVDLAINKARLLIQEIELLRAYTGKAPSIEEAEGTSSAIEAEDDAFENDYPEPELEILQFEEGEFPETEEFQDEELNEEEPDEEELDEDEEEDLEEELEEEDDDDIVLEEIETEKEEEEEEEEEEFLEEENQEEETGEEEIGDEETDEDEFEEELEENEVPEKSQVVEHNELKIEPQAGIREIHIDDIDDDDIEPIRITPPTGQPARPPMREIPKPEPIVEEKQEKVIVGEAFQKERSLNDTIGEHKSEPKLTNSPISSLRATIGLNDRFLFIREIFNNNTEKYNKVIETLDTLDTITEAVEYLKANLTMQKNEASLRFVELLKRRFTK